MNRDINYYNDLVDEINLNDITSSKENYKILQRLKDNEQRSVVMIPDIDIGRQSNDGDFTVRDGDDLGWLGYFIGKSNQLSLLGFHQFQAEREQREQIYEMMEGIKRNQSISRLVIDTDHVGIIENLGPLFGGNKNLKSLHYEGEHTLNVASALEVPSSLTCLNVHGQDGLDDDGDEGLLGIFTALRGQAQLEQMSILGYNFGRPCCEALGTLLRTTSRLTQLDLGNNAIDDLGLCMLAAAAGLNCHIQRIFLVNCQDITAVGLRAFGSVFQSVNCNLQYLDIRSIRIDDAGLEALATGLAGNKSLNTLRFDRDDASITGTGWSALSTLLCDTSSINNIYLSNHTLRNFGSGDTPSNIVQYLKLNEIYDRRAVAKCKILLHHPDLNVEPFFLHKLKFLPIVMSWLQSGTSYLFYLEESHDKYQRRELSTVYKFIRGMPLTTVDGYWNQRLKDIHSKKRQLQLDLQMLEDDERCVLKRVRR